MTVPPQTLSACFYAYYGGSTLHELASCVDGIAQILGAPAPGESGLAMAQRQGSRLGPLDTSRVLASTETGQLVWHQRKNHHLVVCLRPCMLPPEQWRAWLADTWAQLMSASGQPRSVERAWYVDARSLPDKATGVAELFSPVLKRVGRLDFTSDGDGVWVAQAPGGIWAIASGQENAEAARYVLGLSDRSLPLGLLSRAAALHDAHAVVEQANGFGANRHGRRSTEEVVAKLRLGLDHAKKNALVAQGMNPAPLGWASELSVEIDAASDAFQALIDGQSDYGKTRGPRLVASTPGDATTRAEIVMSRAETLRQQATIGIITALPKEYAAVRVMLESETRWTAPDERSRRLYHLGVIPAAEGGHHVVAVALLSDMGNNSAAVSATRMLNHFPGVKHLIMCGIAGGVPRPGDSEHDVRLGDIVVSNRQGVVQFDLVKEKPDASKEHRFPPRPPGPELLAAVRVLQSEELLGNRPWDELLARGGRIQGAQRPRDHLDARGVAVEYPDDPARTEGLPRVFAGTIAASNTLLKNSEHRDFLGESFGAKAVEMEGSGVADATWEDGLAGYLVVRGICDYCDENKGDLWQGAAAVAAAAYCRAVLESMAADSRGDTAGVLENP